MKWMILSRILSAAAVLTMFFAAVTGGLTAALLGGLLVCLVLLCDRLLLLQKEKAPIATVEAEVLAHWITTNRAGKHHYTYCWIMFLTADGQRLQFKVSKLDYDDFDVGERGPLRYRSGQFLSFGVKDKSHIKPMAPLPEEYEMNSGSKEG